MISTILNIIHLLFLFIPQFIFFIPHTYIIPLFKWIMLMYMLTPIHWPLFGNKCILTIITNKIDNVIDDISFSEVWMKWLYKPIMTLIGWDWNKEGLTKMIYLHWIVIFITLWFYAFIYAPNHNINIIKYKCK